MGVLSGYAHRGIELGLSFAGTNYRSPRARSSVMRRWRSTKGRVRQDARGESRRDAFRLPLPPPPESWTRVSSPLRQIANMTDAYNIVASSANYTRACRITLCLIVLAHPVDMTDETVYDSW